MTEVPGGRLVRLPPPGGGKKVLLEAALSARRSVREYAQAPLSLAEVSRLLWAAGGVVSSEGRRTIPSAGALYPLELHLVAGEVESLEPGRYRYRPEGHLLVAEEEGEMRAALCRACLGQECVRDCAAVVVIAAVALRTTARYGRRGLRYIDMEVGHAAQNVHLQAAADGLGTVVVGAFHDEEVRRLLGLSTGEAPLALMPVGRPR